MKLIKINENDINKIKELNNLGKTPKQISKILNLNIVKLYRLFHELNILTERQSSMKEQCKLKIEGKRKCYFCTNVYPMTNEYFGVSKGIWRRRCKNCDNKCSNLNHKKRMKSLNLEDAIRYKFYQAKYRCQKLNREFNLLISDVKDQWNKQNGKCYYTGIEMVTLPNNYNFFSIDRYDSSKGYIKENIVICCHIINLMKKDLSEKDFKFYCKAVTIYNI